MKAEYMLDRNSDYVEANIQAVDDVVRLIEAIREKSGTEWKTSFFLLGDEINLSLAPVGESMVSLNCTDSDGSWSFTSVDPDSYGGDDITFWFYYHGDASELPIRFAVSQDLAMAAVQEFIQHPGRLPEVTGLVWEQD